MKGEPDFKGLEHPEAIEYFPRGDQSGLRDDPFIFQRFFKKNVVAAVFRIPASCFPKDRGTGSFLVWATSTRHGKQLDHDGRSLRTQQPRFNFLNTVAPRDQAAAVKERSLHPDFMGDLFLRFGFDFTFEYRPWDVVPDVVIYNPDFRTRFPNGRLLTDDVGALLARNGDTLLQELSFKNDVWPRATSNDKPFQASFPYLADPWPADVATPPPMGHALTLGHKLQIIFGVVAFVLILLVIGWAVGRFTAPRRKLDDLL